MPDESTEYKKAFLELMGYSFPQVKVGERFYGALFQPTFHPHSCITLFDKGDPIEIGLSIVEGCFNGVYRVVRQQFNSERYTLPKPPERHCWEDLDELNQAEKVLFRARLVELDPANLLENTDRNTRDGLGVICWYSDVERQVWVYFNGISEDDTPRHYAWLRTLVDLAQAHFLDGAVQDYLSILISYLGPHQNRTYQPPKPKLVKKYKKAQPS